MEGELEGAGLVGLEEAAVGLEEVVLGPGELELH